MYHLLLEAGEAGAASSIGMFLPLIILVAVMYLFMIRPQRKREKQVQEMRSKLEIGDEIVTGGGIIGTVVKISDDYLVIETGSDRSKIRIARWAVQVNNTAQEAAAAAKAAGKK